MSKRIKKKFTRIFISAFAVAGAFAVGGVWGNSSKLDKLDSGSSKLLKGGDNVLKFDAAQADSCTPDWCGNCYCGDAPDGGGCGSSAGAGGAGDSGGGCGAGAGGCDGGACI